MMKKWMAKLCLVTFALSLLFGSYQYILPDGQRADALAAAVRAGSCGSCGALKLTQTEGDLLRLSAQIPSGSMVLTTKGQAVIE